MLGLQFIREHPELVRAGAARKGDSAPVDAILQLDGERRALITRLEALRAQQNARSAEVGRESRQAGGPSPATVAALGELKQQIQALEGERQGLDERIMGLLLEVPNLPHDSVPDGSTDDDNQVVRTFGQRPRFDFTPRPHYELGEQLGLFDFGRAVKVAGARFALLCGDGARLERALTTLMLDLATRRHGYQEVSPPYLVQRACMVGTANLPKFEADAFHVVEGDRFLIPTAEVPLTNLYREEILEAEALPIRHVAWTPCWRSEAGAQGRDTRGYIRMHQFSKVELVKLVRPETSLDELEALVQDAEAVLQALGLHYRVRLMCAGDMGFAQWKKYDIDVYAPGLDRFLEVSSCSSFADFQARRANIRFRPGPGERLQFVHTLNGSALALPRTLDAVMETYQQADGSIRIPTVLRPYFGEQERIG
ncbi:MAG TPA: serine--tRNA ligase [Candidatus Dormibacteraeota bacterium]|nr:serine--tRNA ligase [Candidatus Dormibacteraeota bacterium]